MFESGGWFFSFGFFEHGLWLLGRGAGVPGEPAPGALAAEYGSRRSPAPGPPSAGARSPRTPLPPPARALSACLGLPGLGGGTGAESAPRLGVSYLAAVLVFGGFPRGPQPPPPIEC